MKSRRRSQPLRARGCLKTLYCSCGVEAGLSRCPKWRHKAASTASVQCREIGFETASRVMSPKNANQVVTCHPERSEGSRYLFSKKHEILRSLRLLRMTVLGPLSNRLKTETPVNNSFCFADMAQARLKLTRQRPLNLGINQARGIHRANVHSVFIPIRAQLHADKIFEGNHCDLPALKGSVIWPDERVWNRLGIPEFFSAVNQMNGVSSGLWRSRNQHVEARCMAKAKTVFRGYFFTFLRSGRSIITSTSRVSVLCEGSAASR